MTTASRPLLPHRVTIIGLDAFGSSLARTLARQGFEVTGLD